MITILVAGYLGLVVLFIFLWKYHRICCKCGKPINENAHLMSKGEELKECCDGCAPKLIVLGYEEWCSA